MVCPALWVVFHERQQAAMETVGKPETKHSLMEHLSICEEVSKVSAELRHAVLQANRLKLPASYIIGVVESVSKRLDQTVNRYSGGIYK